ncbi:MAG: heparan-alpha-glucosaminide N-acetyltransferase [Methanobacteriaceae archaeon]|nr:heparan-alpha-glucosaminide N-acetyltransferase [Methanobacteriaceae archaeon]
MNKELKIRFWEIDSLRGLAIILMIIYHFLFDLNYFNIYNINLSTEFYWWFTRFAASIFIILVGVSLTLSYSRSLMMNSNKQKSLFIKYLKRGFKIFFYGIIITFITWIFIREDFIIFGILHFIGLAIILEYPFIKYRYLNLVLGIIFIIFGIILSYFRLNFNLVWIGIVPLNLSTVDYFPILPWLGVVSIGLFLGNIFYRNYKRRFYLPDLSQNKFIQFLSLLGRNSLTIYFIHQPLLIAVLYLFGGLNISILLN